MIKFFIHITYITKILIHLIQNYTIFKTFTHTVYKQWSYILTTRVNNKVYLLTTAPLRIVSKIYLFIKRRDIIQIHKSQYKLNVAVLLEHL